MAKYIIEVPDNTQWIQWMNTSKKDGHAYFDYKAPEELTPYAEPDREAIENEVWEFVRCIMGMNANKYRECFDIDDIADDDFACKYTYQEAKKIYEEWKKEKNEIRIGDEVEYICPEGICRFVVFAISGDIAYGFKYPCEDDDFNEYCEIAFLTKTGRHFSEVEKLVEKMSCRSISF